MASSAQRITWGSLQWEAYAIRHCGNVEPEGAVLHHYSHSPENFLTAGRVSYLRDEKFKVITLTFRGSSNLANYRNDVLCGFTDLNHIKRSKEPLQKNLQDIELHLGFSCEYKALQPLFQQLLDQMERDQKEGWHLLITGHSLGGSLATLCVADILFNRTTMRLGQLALVTFGSPRTGNKAFSTWIDQAPLLVNTRVEIEGDPVVSLPAQNSGAFHHRGRLALLRWSPSAGLQRVEFSSELGEKNGVFRDFGNFFSSPLRHLDAIDPAISRVTTSVLGALIDFVVTPWGVGTHHIYWDCQQYREEARA